MPDQPRILAFAASLRRGSWNRKLIRVAAEGAREAGAEVTLLDLKEYPLPVYDGDIEAEQGLPEGAIKLKEIFKQHQGMLISSPEYNGGYPGMLKNLIDWVSRPMEGEKPFEPFRYKPVGAMAASPGRLGGNRMMATLRGLLTHMQMLVVPEVYGLSGADTAFDERGKLKDPKAEAAVKKISKAVVELTRKLNQ
jgi:chromate reductase, NAD(P)H dehydrogenase (quinone)